LTSPSRNMCGAPRVSDLTRPRPQQEPTLRGTTGRTGMAEPDTCPKCGSKHPSAPRELRRIRNGTKLWIIRCEHRFHWVRPVPEHDLAADWLDHFHPDGPH
jgi:hypothetical protein